MHKNIPVVEITISEYSGNIEKHGAVHEPAHLPIGTTIMASKDRGKDKGKDEGRIAPAKLNEWWIGRSIPASRDGILDVLEALGFQDTALLLPKCYGLSLSDQYWVCSAGSGLRWDNVNFFHNSFPKDMGDILFGHGPADTASISLISPDNTSDGWLRKKWVTAGGKRCLMKGGSGVFLQEPFNEAIACAVMRRLNISHVPYTLIIEGAKPYSLCENFVTPDTELIPAWRVINTIKKDNRDSNLAHLLRCAKALGIHGVRAALEKMMALDYIIANEDRHYNNFGFIRNAETLEWLGAAPVYDSGTSLWHNTLRVGSPVESKPFRKSHVEQIKLVEDFSWFGYSALGGLDGEVIEILSQSEEIDERRRGAIASAVMGRCGQVERIAASLRRR
jgi:hypothetical protein